MSDFSFLRIFWSVWLTCMSKVLVCVVVEHVAIGEGVQVFTGAAHVRGGASSSFLDLVGFMRDP